MNRNNILNTGCFRDNKPTFRYTCSIKSRLIFVFCIILHFIQSYSITFYGGKVVIFTNTLWKQCFLSYDARSHNLDTILDLIHIPSNRNVSTSFLISSCVRPLPSLSLAVSKISKKSRHFFVLMSSVSYKDWILKFSFSLSLTFVIYVISNRLKVFWFNSIQVCSTCRHHSSLWVRAQLVLMLRYTRYHFV